MRVGERSYEAVWWDHERRSVAWIDQNRLPFSFEIRVGKDPEQVARAIESMQVRGAPTIGAAAAYGLALAALKDRARFRSHWLSRFGATRPTAVNLFHACRYMDEAESRARNAGELIEAAVAYARREIEANRKMGEHLAARLAVGKRRILTHCNAGWLAAVDWGTALSGIYTLARQGEKPMVWVDETRPRLQGARLTAWELAQEGIECRIQADATAAWRMRLGEVDAVVVGADRIAGNGDVANKIGTYALALAARAHGIPFFVAAPTSTLDSATPSGERIPIEERDAAEVTRVSGVDERGTVRTVRIAAEAPASNPAFDVTPYALITEIVTERGPWRPA